MPLPLELFSGCHDPEPGKQLMARIALVVAVARNGVIGLDGKLPWRVSGDLQKFKQTTIGKPVIMGRKTWESLPRRPLPGRTNIVLTRNAAYKAPGAMVAQTNHEALSLAQSAQVEEICIIGGAEIYRAFWPLASRIYLTEIDATPKGDTVFHVLDPAEWAEIERQPLAARDGDTAKAVFRILENRAVNVLQKQ
jgi:dihydrofolate reductase